MRQNNGFALIIVVIVTLVTAFICLGIASFVGSSIRMTGVRSSMEAALAAAQAGAYAAIVDYKAGSRWSGASDVSLDTNISYSLGNNANFLLLDATTVQRSGSALQRFIMTNCHSSPPPYDIAITGIKVEWDFIGNLTGVVLNSSTVWSGSITSPATPPLASPVTLTAGQTIGDLATVPPHNRLIFSTSVPSSARILVTFTFSADGSSRTAYLLNNGYSGNKEFSITSTGKAGGEDGWKKTIEATYDITANKITSWKESPDHI